MRDATSFEQMDNGLMPLWVIALGAGAIVLILMRAVAARRLQAGDGRLTPFLFAPSVLLILYPVVAIALQPKLDLLGIALLGFLAINAVLLLRPLLKAAAVGRSGNKEKVVEVLNAELGDAMVASVGLGLIAAMVGGVVLVIYAAVTGGR